MNMTYRQLAEEITKMPDEWKDANVTVLNPDFDECYPIACVQFSDGEVATALDEGHPVLTMDL